MEFFTIFLVVVFVACIYFGFIRNTQVLNFRKSIIYQISRDAQAEIHAMADEPSTTALGVQARGDQLLARYRIMDDPSYGEMVLKFWKPLNRRTWYPDVEFLKENA